MIGKVLKKQKNKNMHNYDPHTKIMSIASFPKLLCSALKWNTCMCTPTIKKIAVVQHMRIGISVPEDLNCSNMSLYCGMHLKNGSLGFQTNEICSI